MNIKIKGLLANEPVDLVIEIETTPDEAAEHVLQFYESMINKMTKTRVDRMADKIREMLGI